jgi:hypothetical protein
MEMEENCGIFIIGLKNAAEVFGWGCVYLACY